MKPSFFLLGPLWLLILSSLFLASGLASSWSACLFDDTLGPCPWPGLDSHWRRTFHDAGVIACFAPQSWAFWRRLEPLHSIEEPVLFRHIKNVQEEPRKKAFKYSRMGPVCFRLINMSDHNRNPPFCLKLVLKMDLIALHAPRSLRLLVCYQNLAEPSSYMAAVLTDASSDVVRQAAPYPSSISRISGAQERPTGFPP